MKRRGRIWTRLFLGILIFYTVIVVYAFSVRLPVTRTRMFDFDHVVNDSEYNDISDVCMNNYDGTIISSYQEYQSLGEYCGFDLNSDYNEIFFDTHSLILYAHNLQCQSRIKYAVDTFFDNSGKETIRLTWGRWPGMCPQEYMPGMEFIEIKNSRLHSTEIEFTKGYFGL